MMHLTTFLVSFLLCLSVLAQTNFDRYKTLKSAGEIPADFSAYTYQKIEGDRGQNDRNLSHEKEEIFLQGIHYGIDDILHSGMVVYGDEVSLYIKSIADKLLENNPELRNQLRFYTLKANETNAFSTDQGIVFVTTGLIAQLASEAQLAFVLAHEISHYTEKHVVQSFEYRTKSRNSNIRELSIYSKDKELDADKLGMKLYHDAGYSMEEMMGSFDVIMYSYLPFDEIPFPKDYFSSSDFFIPESLFPVKKSEITAEEDYNDELSSHPNIKKRKEALENEVDNYSNWGKNAFLLGKEKFENIRNICRFESVRTDVLDANYGDAIYSIFLLEKQFPNSLFLKRMKAQVWLGLVKYKNNGSLNQTVASTNDAEGEIAAVHYFLKKLKQDALATLALRQVYDLKATQPDDKELNAIYTALLKELAETNYFKLENYAKKNFRDAQLEFTEKQKNPGSVQDTATVKMNKYDKIKHKKNANNIDNFDSTKYYLYGIPDLMRDSTFLSTYRSFKKKIDDEERAEEELEKLSSSEQEKIRKKRSEEVLHIGAESMIIVDPQVFSFRHDELDLVKSEKLKQEFSSAIQSSADDLGMKIFLLNQKELSEKGTDCYNARNVLFNFMSQVSNKNFGVFPVDYELLEDIKNTYGTSKVLFSWVSHSYSIKPSAGEVFLLIIAYPIIPVYFSIKIFTGNHTEMNAVVLDLEKGGVETDLNYSFKDKPHQFQLAAHMYSILKKLSTKKSEK